MCPLKSYKVGAGTVRGRHLDKRFNSSRDIRELELFHFRRLSIPLISQGNVIDLERYFKRELHNHRFTVAYFGDSLKSDIISADKTAGWRCVYLVEELYRDSQLVHVDDRTLLDCRGKRELLFFPFFSVPRFKSIYSRLRIPLKRILDCRLF